MSQLDQACQAILEKMADEYGFELVVYEQVGIGYKEVAMGRLDAHGRSTYDI